jgi:hypothetical protein
MSIRFSQSHLGSKGGMFMTNHGYSRTSKGDNPMKKLVVVIFLIAILICVAGTVADAQNTSSTSAIGAEDRPWVESLSANIVPAHNFDGLGCNSFGICPNAPAPDPAGAVGTTQYIEWVSGYLAVFNKGTGAIIGSPVTGSSIFTSLGGPCATYNDGQPVVQFDKLAQRWVIGQLVLTGPPYYFCVAVSQNDDGSPGNYYLYSFQLNDLPDSPRLSVWPDAYYVTLNMYSGSAFLYANVCALDRASMINGQPARPSLCKPTSQTYPSLLPADLDGAMLPPSGSPNFLLSLGSNALNFWTYHVDFVQGTSTLNGPTPIPVQPFSPACQIPSRCIQQKGTANLLTALSDRLMYRAAYRNFGDHESLTVNHTIIFALKTAAVRWYELRNVSSPKPTVYQWGTHTPTGEHRWMGNIAMDSMGDIAVAYNISSVVRHPALGFAARLATDPSGQLGAENIALAGTGSQTSGSAWGNSTSLSVDPMDDCTFWIAGEYLRADGTNWNTKIASFSLNSCPSSNPGIQITGSPDYGTDDRPLSGTVTNISPGDYGKYKVGVLLFISGIGWWSKPFCNQLFVPISNGTWSADVGTGGPGSEDYSAVKYVAYLLPQGAMGTCHGNMDGLPLDLETQAVARAYLDRPNPGRRHIVFAGLNWDVTANTFGPIYPGPCIFSDSTNNVFIDGSGNLHLKIVNAGGTWTCSEVVPRVNDQLQQEQRYAYGTYTYYLANAVDNLDPNAVVGLFTWSNDPAYAGPFSPWENNPQGGVGGHSELDVEFSKGLAGYPPHNAQFCVQPYTSNPCSQFTMPAGYNNSTAIINWFPNGINFQVQDANGNVLANYSYSGAVPPPADNGGWNGLFPSPQQARLNLWAIGGSPLNGQEVEVVISGFTYVPYSN